MGVSICKKHQSYRRSHRTKYSVSAQSCIPLSYPYQVSWRCFLCFNARCTLPWAASPASVCIALPTGNRGMSLLTAHRHFSPRYGCNTSGSSGVGADVSYAQWMWLKIPHHMYCTMKPKYDAFFEVVRVYLSRQQSGVN